MPIHHLQTAAADFRDAAWSSSRASLGERSMEMTSAELLEAGVSCCIPVSDNGPALLKADRTRTVVCGAIGFGLAGLCILLVLLSARNVIVQPAAYVPAACMISGIGFLFYGGMYGQRGTIRKVVRRRLGSLPRELIHAELEDTRTVDKLKWSPEDIVLVIPNPEQHLLHLEGLRYRYVVRGEDVTMIEHAGPKKAGPHRLSDRRDGAVVRLDPQEHDRGTRVYGWPR